jgi:superfamily II DNA/RNA helicase
LYLLSLGKTGTFAIGFLARIDPKVMAPQILVLSPTRDLAQQTARVTNALGSYLSIEARAFIGGTSVREDIDALRHGQVEHRLRV